MKRLRVLQSHVLECKDMKQYLCLDVDAEVDESDQVVEELFEGVDGSDEAQLQHDQSSHLPSTPKCDLECTHSVLSTLGTSYSPCLVA